jgi:hypothetical protein
MIVCDQLLLNGALLPKYFAYSFELLNNIKNDN